MRIFVPQAYENGMTTLSASCESPLGRHSVTTGTDQSLLTWDRTASGPGSPEIIVVVEVAPGASRRRSRRRDR
jgi:hypothetical protein